MTNLVLYWISFIILIENELHSDGHNIFLFIQPLFFYVIFFSLHISDADRDEQPTSQSMFVNVDQLELFYSVWFLFIHIIHESTLYDFIWIVHYIYSYGQHDHINLR